MANSSASGAVKPHPDYIFAAYIFAARSFFAWMYSRSNRSTRSATLSILSTMPTPWPEPQMSFHAFALLLPPDPKFIALGSLVGRFSGSRPAFSIEPRK